MTLEQLQHLAQAGVKVEISAADLLQVFKSIAEQAKAQETCEKQLISIHEAERAYYKSRKTIVKMIETGVLHGEKLGGTWAVESPSARAARLRMAV